MNNTTSFVYSWVSQSFIIKQSQYFNSDIIDGKCGSTNQSASACFTNWPQTGCASFDGRRRQWCWLQNSSLSRNARNASVRPAHDVMRPLCKIMCYYSHCRGLSQNVELGLVWFGEHLATRVQDLASGCSKAGLFKDEVLEILSRTKQLTSAFLQTSLLFHRADADTLNATKSSGVLPANGLVCYSVYGPVCVCVRVVWALFSIPNCTWKQFSRHLQCVRRARGEACSRPPLIRQGRESELSFTSQIACDILRSTCL